MRLSRRPSARRRRRILALVVMLGVAGLAAAALLRPDPVTEYARSLGFNELTAGQRTRVDLPSDLSQPPYDSYLSASRAAGLDFARFAGKAVTHVAIPLGQVPGRDQTVQLNVYLSGRRVIGAFLTGVIADEATPVNTPDLAIEPSV